MIRPVSQTYSYPRTSVRVAPQLRTDGEARVQGGVTYIVQKGDSLSKIAQNQLGDANRWREIYELNKDLIGADPNRIFPGQVLRLPASKASNPPAASILDQLCGWVKKGFDFVVDALKRLFNPPATGVGPGAKIVDGALRLHRNGYVYPPNLTDQYRHVPGKIGCCADFACDSYAAAGYDVGSDMKGKGYNPHYCPSMIRYFDKYQQYLGANSPAKVGDIVFFDWDGGGYNDPDHVAVVLKVDAQGRPVQLAESRSFNHPTEITTMSWNPADSRARKIVGYGRLR
ncbi:MAG: LysM peptidoglycan-binding domain-containing protein [Bacteroidota bacterium]